LTNDPISTKKCGKMETLYNLQLFFKEPIKDAELEASNKVFQLVFPSVKVLAGKFEMC